MIFQDPMTSLNPVMKVGKQIAEPLRIHLDMSRADAKATALRLLEDVGIPEPDKRLDQYPHELSGGMRQRIMIAMALACGPTLLFADEPTTALDVTVQAQILDLHPGPAAGPQHVGHPRDPRPRRRRRAHRRDHRDVRRPDRRAGADARAVQRDADALHRGAAGEHPQARPAQPHACCGPSPDARPTSSTRPRDAASAPGARTCRTGAARRPRRWSRPRPPGTATPAGTPSAPTSGRRPRRAWPSGDGHSPVSVTRPSRATCAGVTDAVAAAGAHPAPEASEIPASSPGGAA